jgi:hypothetical protein
VVTNDRNASNPAVWVNRPGLPSPAPDATTCVFLGGLYRAEQVIAERLRCLVNGTLPWPYIDPGKALPWIEQKPGPL